MTLPPLGSRRRPTRAAALLLLLLIVAGCQPGPHMVPVAEQKPIDRQLVESPAGFELRPYLRNLTSPTAIAFDTDGSILVAEGGAEPRVVGFKPDGALFEVYPRKQKLFLGLGGDPFRIFGPIGGMAVYAGEIYISHRDKDDSGVITALKRDGTHRTVIADLPAQGDYGVTDLAFADGRLHFGVGAATNSGVVGLDNWATGWPRKHSRVHDEPNVPLKLHGFRFDTPNPQAGLGAADVAVSGGFQYFGLSNMLRVPRPRNGKPNSALYSVAPSGGDLRVEASGIRLPRGIAFNEFGRQYVTNNGMELRGTRPVMNDPDTLLRVVAGTWYGWPDYSADLLPISNSRFQPPIELIRLTGYPELSFLLDHEASELSSPDRETLLSAAFPSLAGAAKLTFVPTAGAFREFRGAAIVAMSGDRAPFATSGRKLLTPPGRRVVLVDVDTHQVREFVRNTKGIPASQIGKGIVDALERPTDVKFGPDGALYILDLGQMSLKGGRESVVRKTGRVFRLVPMPEPQATAPTTAPRGPAADADPGDAGVQ